MKPAFVIVFAVVYAIAYVVSVLNNYALFTYHPAIAEFGAGVQKGKDGPAMYWFGWMATSGFTAALTAAAAAMIPESVTRRLGPGAILVVTLLAMAVFAYDLRQFFFK